MAGTVDVTIVDGGGTSQTSSADQFTYVYPPWVAVTTPQGTQSSGVGIMYDLSDDESDSCSIQVNYSINGGSTWYPATAVSGSDTSSLSSSPNGSPHYYVWDSVADLGYVANSNVQIEITPTAAGVSGAAIATYSFTVDNTTVLPPPTINSPGDTSAPGQVLPNSQPTFTWTAVPGAASYTVYAKDTTSNTLYEADSPGGTTNVSNYLPNSDSFYWWVTTFNNADVEGDHSSYLYFRTPPADTTPPVADLSDPANGGSILFSTLNSRKYIDITFSDTGSGLNTSTITDSDAEFTLSGSAASGVTINGSPTLVDGTTYRYTFTGNFGAGPVSVNFTAGSFADNAGNLNAASDQTFTVDSVPPSVGSLSVSPDPVTQGNSITLTANNVTDSDGTVTKIEFYRDANGNGVIDPGTDTLLGTDTNGSDGWTWTGSTSDFPVGSNTYMAWAQDSTSAWSNVATVTGTVNPQATPTITWPNPADIVYGTALSNTQLDAMTVPNVPGIFAYTPDSGTVLHAGDDQTLSVTFTPTDTTDYTTATMSVTINVQQATPTITWANPADIVYGTPLGDTQLDAKDSVPGGTFAYTPLSGTVLHAGNGQALSVTFTPTDSTDYTTVTKSVTINVEQATPTITWPNPADIIYGTPLSNTQLDATASVPGGTFAYTPLSGTVLHAGNGQTLSVTFTPTDTVDYTTATNSVTVSVEPATPTITWPNPADIIYGTALGNMQLDAMTVPNVPGSFAYTPASGTVLHAGNGQTLSVTFTPTDTTDYTTATKSVSINVQQATPTITWSNPADIIYGTALSNTQLDAITVPSVPGTFAYTPASGTVLPLGNGQTLSVTFTPTDATDYTVATKSVSINVQAEQITPTITWSNPADIFYGTALSNAQLDAVTVPSVPGTFVYAPASGTVLHVGDGQTLSVIFTPTDTTDYTTATKSVSINVEQATPTITWSNPADIIYGTALGGTQLDATANVLGTFAYMPTGGTVLHAGDGQTLSVLFTPTDTVDYTTATKSVTINVEQATPTITWSNPADIIYGTALSSTQLDATASAAGTFAYTPDSGTVLHAGVGQTLSVIFTPTDTIDYTTATKSVSINVDKTAPTITWSNPADIVYGTALDNTQLDATADVPGMFVYTPASGTVLHAGDGQTLSVVFTPTDTTDYTTATKSVTINVEQATPTITWSNPADIIYGTALSDTQLDATANVLGTLAYTPASGTVLPLGNGQTLSVVFTPTDTIDYTTATKSVSINVNQAGPIVSSVVIAEAAAPKNGILESCDKLVITWAATSPNHIASQSMTLDGKKLATIYGPYGGLYYSCPIGTCTVGSHTYSIQSIDSKGLSSTSAGTFNVLPPAPPSITGVVVAEASAPKNGILESSDSLKITWAATSSLGIAAKTVTVDGKAIAPINGPYGGLYYSCAIGIWSAGTHTYVIAATDSKGGTFSSTGTFTVAASSVPVPAISSVLVAEAATPKNGILESSDQLKITWAASQGPIASQNVMIDGRRITTINGPYGHLYYSCSIGAWSAGTHFYSITATNASGFSSTSSGTFSVAASAITPITIGSVVVAEAAAPRDGVLGSTEALVITWAASASNRIASQAVTIDGRTVSPVYGPYGGLYYSCPIGAWSAGSHAYTITTTDAKGLSATSSGSFAVLAPSNSSSGAGNAAASQHADLLAAVMREMNVLGPGDSASDDLADAMLT